MLITVVLSKALTLSIFAMQETLLKWQKGITNKVLMKSLF
ncbi:UNVERIFIED_CONTAM: hypothetical protein GTU68_007875 [Idotea baltica]|nr:hypothetical protein [Idotea baltica]